MVGYWQSGKFLISKLADFFAYVACGALAFCESDYRCQEGAERDIISRLGWGTCLDSPF